jgi:prephenate dehydrogenase
VSGRDARPPTTVAIIGTGLIGTSIALALRRANRQRPRIIGWDRSPSARASAARRRCFSRLAASLDDAAGDVDVVIVAAPLDATVKMLPQVIAAAKPGALVMDVAGLKKPVVGAASGALRKRNDVAFVSGHPLAGKERSGADHADPSLFAGHPFTLSAPAQRDRATALARAETVVRLLGARPILLTPQAHDEIVAATSALPQLAAVMLALTVDALTRRTKAIAGPGYADATRLAQSPFSVWKPVLRSSKPAIRRALRQLERALNAVRGAVGRQDDRPMERLFSQAAAARRRVVGK